MIKIAELMEMLQSSEFLTVFINDDPDELTEQFIPTLRGILEYENSLGFPNEQTFAAGVLRRTMWRYNR